MKTRAIYLFIITIFLNLAACNTEEDLVGNSGGPNSSNQDNWLIPQGEVLDGGPGKDGIPALIEPKFDSPLSIDYLDDDDLIIGYKHGDETRAYPHLILDYHEIINDEIEDNTFAITYCPLTGTGINWNRKVKGAITTFGVSGLLYNTNLIPYDRETNSNWSQMLLQCVNGPLIGTETSIFQIVETDWGTWKEMYPDTKVMTLETGYSRNYGSYPYYTSKGDYRQETYLIFPVANSDDRLHPKERVHGIIEGEEVKVFRFDDFDNEGLVIEDIVGGQKVAIVGSKEDNYMVSFEIEDNELSVHKFGESVFKDQNENHYNIFGEIIEGPDIGGQLTPTRSFIGYWFSWAAFYPEVTLHNSN